MWRPKDWRDKTQDIVVEAGMLPPQVKYPIVIPSGLEWDILKRQLFEAGADAMLEALRCNQWCPFDDSVMKANFKGWIVFIPDEEEDGS